MKRVFHFLVALMIIVISVAFLLLKTHFHHYDINQATTVYIKNFVQLDSADIRLDMHGGKNADIFLPGHAEPIPLRIMTFGQLLEQYLSPQYVDGRYIHCSIREEFLSSLELNLNNDEHYSHLIPPNDWNYFGPHDEPYYLEAKFNLDRRTYNRLSVLRESKSYRTPSDWQSIYDQNIDCFLYIQSISSDLDSDIVLSMWEAFMATHDIKPLIWMIEEFVEKSFAKKSNEDLLKTAYKTKLKNDSFVYYPCNNNEVYPLILSGISEIDSLAMPGTFFPSILIPPQKGRMSSKMNYSVSYLRVSYWTYVRVFSIGKIDFNEKLGLTLSYCDSLQKAQHGTEVN